MIRPRGGWSIRTALFGMIALATVPPIAIGLWQIRSAGNAGRDLLASQLDQELSRIAGAIRTRWEYRQGGLMLLAGNEVARLALTHSGAIAADDAAYLRDLFGHTEGVDRAALADATGHARWSVASESAAVGEAPETWSGALPVTIPVVDSTGAKVGELRAAVSLASILPAQARGSEPTPPVLSVFDAEGRSPLATPVLPIELLRGDSFNWRGNRWLTRRRVIDAPALSLVLAAPLDPFVSPFQRAARERTAALVIASAVALLLATFLASQFTGSVHRLMEAAEDVAKGKLEARIENNGTAELSRLAVAFNAMTAALDDTLRRLAQRESVAAVGEFAASLAHEIRNPLTAIRVDLQHLSRRAELNGSEREALDRSLRQVQRLDRAVSGALDIARSGQARLQRVALTPVLRDAIAAAAPELSRCGARVEWDAAPDHERYVLADPSALHQLLLNVVLNAAQAVTTDGIVELRVEGRGGLTVVRVTDNGRGIPAADLPHVFEPFFSKRPGGTGLGLAVSRQIALAHGGRLDIESGEDSGTSVALTLRSA